MFNRFILILLCMFTAQGTASAQNCSVIYEEASKMRKPPFGSSSIWSMDRGETDNQEIYRTGTLDSSGAIIVAGERQGPKIQDRQIIIAQIGKRGRVTWEKFHAVKGLESVVKILSQGNGYMVLAGVRGAKARDFLWVGFFDAFGKLTDQKIISHPEGSLEGRDIIKAQNGQRFIVAASLRKDGDVQNTSSAILYVLDPVANVISNKAFVLGSENQILGLNPYKDQGYVAAGYTLGTDGRKQGWIVRLDDNLKILWQQVYPRGAGASLEKAQAMGRDAIAVVGTSSPAIKGGLRAGWVMALDAVSGKVIWQRFYSSDVHYAGRELMVTKEGLVSVVLDGDEPKKSQNTSDENSDEKSEEMEHAQMITHDPRGYVIDSQIFYSGEGVDVYSMIQGPSRERLLIGQTMVKHQIPKPPVKAQTQTKPGEKPEQKAEQKPQPEQKPEAPQADKKKISDEDKFDIVFSQQGWVLAAPAIDPYKDPCVKSFTEVP